jgi:hypothetical protein
MALPNMGGLVRSVEGLHRIKRPCKKELFQTHCLSYNVNSTGSQAFRLRLEFTTPLSWILSLSTDDLGTSQPSQSCESTLFGRRTMLVIKPRATKHARHSFTEPYSHPYIFVFDKSPQLYVHTFVYLLG